MQRNNCGSRSTHTTPWWCLWRPRLPPLARPPRLIASRCYYGPSSVAHPRHPHTTAEIRYSTSEQATTHRQLTLRYARQTCTVVNEQNDVARISGKTNTWTLILKSSFAVVACQTGPRCTACPMGFRSQPPWKTTRTTARRAVKRCDQTCAGVARGVVSMALCVSPV